MVFNEGRPFFTKIFTAKAANNGLEASRFAFVFSTKVSKSAVKRNKARRRMREAVRLALPDIRGGYDIVFIAKKDILDKDYAEIESTIKFAFKKMGLLSSGERSGIQRR